MGCPYGLTKDGFETHIGVNYLGITLLSGLSELEKAYLLLKDIFY